MLDEKARAAAIKAVGAIRCKMTGATLAFVPSDALYAASVKSDLPPAIADELRKSIRDCWSEDRAPSFHQIEMWLDHLVRLAKTELGSGQNLADANSKSPIQAREE